MPETIEELSKFIADRTRQEWELTQEPYLLAKIPPALQGQGKNYREIIDPMTLKQFVSSLTDTVQLVQHPTQKSKIGLIPNGATYSFANLYQGGATSVPSNKQKSSYSRNPKNVILNFLQALSHLEAKELEKVQIPISVLVRLLGDE
jgi:hypothetical protein